MGLFDKKICDICGEKIKLLGNRKLEDGNCCKACAAKLSPWFSDRRQSSVAEIKEQLQYREDNKAAVAGFSTTRTIGENKKVLLDEQAGLFMVTSARNIQEANPDVLKFSQVTGCNLDIEENTDEVMREHKDKDGITRRESYSPRRYNYSYDFYITIHVNHPYFDEMKFKLNNHSVDVNFNDGMGMHRGIEGSTTPPSLHVRESNPDYVEYRDMAKEIQEALNQVRTQVREAAAAEAAPKQAVTCPFCGATTIPDANGCCEYCGGSVNG